jgi:hypothetical protein
MSAASPTCTVTTGAGSIRATLWPPGAVIADRFAVRIAPDAVAPVLGRVFARVEPGEPGIEVATVKIVPERFRSAPDVLQAELGDNIALAMSASSQNRCSPVVW